HCSFKWISDGNDIVNAKEVTFSWNRWNGYNEYMCDGRDNYSAMVQGSDVTYDHIWWEGSRGRTAKVYGSYLSHVHMINNYHSDNTFYASSSTDPKSLLKIENSHYDGVRIPTLRTKGGVMYSSGNLYENIEFHSGDNWAHVSEPKDAAANFNAGYPYTLDNVNDVKSICTSRTGAGAQWGTMPKYDDVAGLLSEGPSVSITAPSNGQSFTDPASLTVNAAASGKNGIAKVVFYNGSQKLGEDTSAPYSWVITEPVSCTYSLMAVAYDKKGIATYSAPITFTTAVESSNDDPNLASTYIFTYYRDGGNHSWDYAKNWDQDAVPGSTSTAIIRSGEVHVNGSISAKTYAEPGGTVKIAGASTIDNLTLQGGILSVYTGGAGYPLTSDIVVEQNSQIMVGAYASSVLTLGGTISGTGNLTKTKDGTLLLSKNSDLSKYSGNWTIKEGSVKTEISRIGVGKVYLEGGTLEVGSSFLGI
ncbi:Ig-like domain-containing protein, partial [Fulvivirga kasyanovii]